MQQAEVADVADAEEEDKLFNAIRYMKTIICAIFFGFDLPPIGVPPTELVPRGVGSACFSSPGAAGA
jgi:hypothetical protein